MNVKTIYHLADIHIRNIRRHDEYRDIFSELYKKIKMDTSDAIIVVAGDIIHSKLELSPELVDLTSEFLKELSGILPTFVITGNHDCNVNNKSRMDSLYPIINNIKNNNLYYLKDSQVYEFDNINLVVMSIFDSPDIYTKAEQLPSDKKKIAVYHGTVNNAVSDNGFILHNDKMDVSKFDGYDMVLLGDIHKRQIINSHNPRIEYCGSLIQQNYNEELIHGLLKWNVENNKSDFIEINNPYSYITLIMENNNEPDIKNITKKARVQIKTLNSDEKTVASFVVKLKTQFPELKDVQNIEVQHISELNNSPVNLDVGGDVRDVNFQELLIKEFLEQRHIEDSVMKNIIEINSNLNKKIPPRDIIRNVTWKPKKFTFSNMFSYGEENELDFTKFKGIVGIVGPNTHGKSNLMEAISFNVFDKSPRIYRAVNAVNSRKDFFKSVFNFLINDDEYCISRNGKRNGDTVTVSVDFESLKSGKTESLNGERRDATNSIIRSYLGDYDDFFMTTFSAQANNDAKNSNFISLRQSDRKALFNKFIDIGVFELLHKMASDEIKPIVSKLKFLSDRDFITELSTIDIEHNSLLSKKSQNDAKRQEFYELQTKLMSEIQNQSQKLVKIDITETDISTMLTKKEQAEKHYSELKETAKKALDKLNAELNQKELELSELKAKYSDKDFDEIQSQYLEIQEKERERNEIKSRIEKENIILLNTKTKQDEFSSFVFNSECTECSTNKEYIKTKSDIFSTIDELVKKISEYTDKLSIIDSILVNSEDINNRYTIVLQTKKQKETVESQVLKIKYNISEAERNLVNDETKLFNAITTLTRDIEFYYQNEDNIKHNKDIKLKISDLDSKLKIVNDAIKSITSDSTAIERSIGASEAQRKQVESDMNQREKYEIINEAYEHYLACTEKDGIPFSLLQKTMPKIETEINNILSPIVEFKIKLILDDENKDIIPQIKYDDDRTWPIELASGMERFLITIAIRVALIGVTSLPKTNFIVIDEGFGSLDSENANNLFLLFNYLRLQFDYVLIVSHLDYIKDYVDMYIEVKKDSNGFSTIKMVN